MARNWLVYFLAQKLYYLGMSSKNITVIVALWTLLLAPLFCGLGVVIHACVDEHATECHHELECDVDPCQILVLAATQRYDDHSAPEQTPELLALPNFSEAAIPVFESLPQHPLGCEELITELIEYQRTTPLLS